MSGQENQSFWDEVLDCEFEEKEYQDGFKEGVEAGKLQSLRDGVEFVSTRKHAAVLRRSSLRLSASFFLFLNLLGQAKR